MLEVPKVTKLEDRSVMTDQLYWLILADVPLMKK
jgi:hypothetical protein